MVIWKDIQHELDELQAGNDPMTMRALHECGLLKIFGIPRMRAYVHLLEHMIPIWDPDRQHFVNGTHTLTLDVEDIYFLNGLSHKERPVTLIGP